MELFLKISVLQANFCWLGDLEKIIFGVGEEKWGSFRSRYHFGVELGIVSGLGITSGSGSFRGLDIDPGNRNL